MKPIFTCRLTQEEQAKIRKLLKGLTLHCCGGSKQKVKEYYGKSLEQIVQDGMDLKIVDLKFMMVYYAEEFQKESDDEFFLTDTTVIIKILEEGRKKETAHPFVFPDERGEDDFPCEPDR